MMNQKWILLAEDNPNDAQLSIRALAGDSAPPNVLLAEDGVEVLDCLYCRGKFRKRSASGSPVMVLLDLKMPRINGLEVLRRIKADATLKRIPIVVFSSSREESDLLLSYELGANAYVVKPVEFKEYVAALEDVRTFWIALNEPPPQAPRRIAAGSAQPAIP